MGIAPLPEKGKMNQMEYCLIHRPSSLRNATGHLRSLWAAVQRKFALGAVSPELATAEGRARATINSQAEQILDTYGSSILRFAYSYLHDLGAAEDILQDTLVQFLKTAPIFASEQHEKAWLLRVSANLSKNRLAYDRVRMADELDEELVADQREDLSFVWDAVKALPAQLREIIHLFYYEGYSTKQIGKILGQKEATVRTHLRRGRTRLKVILKGEYDFDETV